MATNDAPLSITPTRGLSLALGQNQSLLSSLPLAPASDLTSGRFIGAFKLQANTINYTTGAMAVSPDDTKIYVAGHVYDFGIHQFNIPALVQETANAGNLNTGMEQQSSGNLFNRIPVKDWSGTGGENAVLTNMAVVGNELIVTGIEYYDGSASSVSTAFRVLDNSDLANSAIAGAYRIGPMSYANGWVSQVPESLTEDLGADLLFGIGAGRPIVSRLSNGPSCWSVKLSDLQSAANDAEIPTSALINYPLAQRLREDDMNYGGAIGANNNTVHTIVSSHKLGFLVPGTRTYAAIGESGGHNPGPLIFTQQDQDGYTAKAPGTPCSTPYTGCHGAGTIFYKNSTATWTTKDGSAVDGYAVWDQDDEGPYLWLYDLDEARGLTNPYDAEPYYAGYISVSFNGSKKVRGACFNPTSKRLYVLTSFEGGMYSSEGSAVVMVFDLSGMV